MVKLNKKRIRWLVVHVVKDAKKPKEISPVFRLSECRVQQLAKSIKKAMRV